MNIPEVVVVDYGVGNLLSVQRGLEHCGANGILTSNPEIILDAKRVILPGVGAFASAMQALENLGLVDVIHEIAKCNTPLLGICLGMQLLLEESEEFGITSGLGLISGRVIHIPNYTISGSIQKTPYIGWSSLQPSDAETSWKKTLLQDHLPNEAVYFLHSYTAVPSDPADRIADFLYGGHKLAAMIGRDKITGCQFHPEKSGEMGLKVLRRFLLQ